MFSMGMLCVDEPVSGQNQGLFTARVPGLA